MIRRVPLIALAAVIGLLTAWPSGLGQGTLNNLVANIPFDFYVGNKLLPAGQYRLQMFSGIVVGLESTEDSALTITRDSWTSEPSRPRLVFTSYSQGQHFLREVWGYGKSGRTIAKSSTEETAVFSDSTIERIAIRLEPHPVHFAR